MITEIFKGLFAQVMSRQAPPDCPSDNVFRGSNVPAGRYFRVAVLKQLFSETFDLLS
jgi:hypothetical protein